MSILHTRREFCGWLGGAACLATLRSNIAFSAETAEQGLILAIGNYGMKSRTVEDAIRLIAETGFDGLELSMMAEWDSAPEKLTTQRRGALREVLANSGLALISLMENTPPSAADAEHKTTLDRLTRAAELGHELSPKKPPIIQTVLGGGVWNEKKELYRDRLGDWLQIAKTTKTVIAIKPHRMGAMSTPAQAVWLLEQLGNSPWLKLVYDYSHYAFRDLAIAETIKTAYPFTTLVAVKDVLRKGEEFEFALPGDSDSVDHVSILKSLYELGYRDGVCCEVSAQLSKRPGYDDLAATKKCYENMSRVFREAGISQRRPKK